MSVRLTPRGTRGSGFGNMAPWMRTMSSVGQVWFFRLLGRRMRIQGRQLLLLTTVGAKTGKRRQTVVASFPDGPESADRWLIVASAAGAATHPAWYVNLARRPDGAAIEVDGHRFAVDCDSLHGGERDRAWKRRLRKMRVHFVMADSQHRRNRR